MKRRNNAATLDMLMATAGRLPWRIGLIAAIVIYVVLHYLAGHWTPVQAAQLADFSKVYVNSMLRAFVSIGQYAIPLILIVAAIGNAVRERSAASRLKRIAGLNDVAALLSMTWQQFEQTVAEYFRHQGYKVALNPQAGPDGGVDIELRKGTELSLVQCKQWRSTQVGVAVVRELYGVMSARGAVHGYVVSAGSFNADASEFVIGRNVTLINGHQLVKSINAVLREAPVKNTRVADALRDDRESLAPRCPACGERMVKRTAARGWEQGKAFWGCSGFPKCRGTRSM